MAGVREGERGRAGEAEKRRGMDGATAQRSDTRGRAGEAAAVWARPQRFEQVERAQATEGEAERETERERECRRKGGREGGSLSFHLKITLSHTSLTLSAGRSSEEGAELIRRCQLLLSGLLLFFFSSSARGVSWTSPQNHPSVISLQWKDWEIGTSKERRLKKWENCSKWRWLQRKRSFTENLPLRAFKR